MRPHKKLEAWLESIQFVVDIYKLTKMFPSEEKYGLTSQMRRAAVSISANIAEGAARKSDKEKINFLFIAEGSSSEMDTYLELSKLINLITLEIWHPLNNRLEKVSALTKGLRKSIERRLPPDTK